MGIHRLGDHGQAYRGDNDNRRSSDHGARPENLYDLSGPAQPQKKETATAQEVLPSSLLPSPLNNIDRSL